MEIILIIHRHIHLEVMSIMILVVMQIIAKFMEEYMEVEPTHMKLGYTTFGTYMTSASLSIFSPPASKYSNRLSSNKIHKYLAIIHFAGMCIQPWLGYETYKSRILDDGNYDKYLDLHQQVGGITMTCYALAFLTTLLPY